jgi:hypothetical protein
MFKTNVLWNLYFDKNICCHVAEVFRKWIDLGHVGLMAPERRGSGPSGASKFVRKWLKNVKIRLFRLEIWSLSYLWTKSGNWLIWMRFRNRIGVDDSIFRLCEEGEEGVDGANKRIEALKKKEMLISFLFWFTKSDIYAIINEIN